MVDSKIQRKKELMSQKRENHFQQEGIIVVHEYDLRKVLELDNSTIIKSMRIDDKKNTLEIHVIDKCFSLHNKYQEYLRCHYDAYIRNKKVE